jgi:hypothetical protein
MISKKKKPFVFLVVFFATILLFLSFWVIRQNSGRLSDSLKINNMAVSTEVNDGWLPAGSVSRFSHGSRQVCLRFDYTQAMGGGEVKVLWFSEEKLVYSDAYPLNALAGTKVYCLVQENGQPLPKGSYSVTVLNKAERLSDLSFDIY